MVNPRLCRHPTIGTVGLTEPEARKKYGDAVKVCESHVFAKYVFLCLLIAFRKL
jgi:pyruvate/2-oxoglutarate dehydrogenase complex dihydrolipoamide dehydrogenase (E3) component